MNVLTLWLVGLMTVLSPPDRDAARALNKHLSTETGEERAERYTSIAADVAAVAEGHALPHQTERETAALLLAVTFYESSFHPHVDNGDCNAKRDGDPKRICDGGDSVGLMQIHFGRGQTSFLGKIFEELRGVENRRTMLATGLAAIRVGVNACDREWKHEHRSSSRPFQTRLKDESLREGLAWYAAGSCQSTGGLADADKKTKLLSRLLGKTPDARHFPTYKSVQDAQQKLADNSVD